MRMVRKAYIPAACNMPGVQETGQYALWRNKGSFLLVLPVYHRMMVVRGQGLNDFFLNLSILRVSPTISLKVDALPTIETDSFCFE